MVILSSGVNGQLNLSILNNRIDIFLSHRNQFKLFLYKLTPTLYSSSFIYTESYQILVFSLIKIGHPGMIKNGVNDLTRI